MARSFNGSSDKITTSSYTFNGTAGTLVVWVKPSGFTNAYNAAASHISGAAAFMQIFTKSTGKLAYYVRGNASIQVDPGTATLSTGTWAHLALTYDTGGLKTFINGANDGTAAVNGTLASINAVFGIGFDSNTAGRFFPGSLADVAQWSVALSASEINALANGARPHTIRPVSITGYWPVDGLQSPEPDLSGSKHNGTLTGTASSAGPPVAMFTSRRPGIVFSPATLSAITGYYVYTGTQAASQKAVTFATGYYSLSGETATLLQGKALPSRTGNYILTGESARLLRGLALPITTGAYTLTGDPQTYRYTRAFRVASGYYLLNGEEASLLKIRSITMPTGFYALTGEAASGNHAWALSPQVGQYTLNGERIVVGRSAINQFGSYSWVGKPATLFKNTELIFNKPKIRGTETEPTLKGLLRKLQGVVPGP